MQRTTNEIDASFYQLIHQLAGPQLSDDPVELRRAVRRPFLALHRIAPRRGAEFPKENEFVDVMCHDLTRAGFSFFLPSPPDFTALVAVFCFPAEEICVGAEVRHFDHVLLYPSGLVEHIHDKAGPAGNHAPGGENPPPMVLVGCRFTERLQRPAPGSRQPS
jgi:hypothetical protein